MRITICRRRSWLVPLMLAAGACIPAVVRAADDSDLLLLPPALDDRAIFYHAFTKGADKPEINAAKATIEVQAAALADGFTGRGLATRPVEGRQQSHGIRMVSPAFSVHRPLTVMFWWRLDAPMKETTGFGLIAIHNHGGRHDGYVSNFVAGKGPWCGLKEPTYISQLNGFPGLTDRNMPWGERVWSEPGQWRHLAMTVTGARQIDIYWDGQHREMFQAQGRLFVEGDTNAIMLGPDGYQVPMTLDEIVVLDRGLTADEIAGYRTASRALQAISSGEQAATAMATPEAAK
jgi:hypothetical protein